MSVGQPREGYAKQDYGLGADFGECPLMRDELPFPLTASLALEAQA